VITFDTNILVYSIDNETPDKRDRSRDLLARARDAEVILAVQVLGEFLNVIRRTKRSQFQEALRQAERFATLFPVIETSAAHIMAAGAFAERYSLQLWDSIIWQVARSAGANFLITEDLQDGLSLEGMTVIDPFNPENDPILLALLEPDE
jgi:predicted nucleic acid-binding protein